MNNRGGMALDDFEFEKIWLHIHRFPMTSRGLTQHYASSYCVDQVPVGIAVALAVLAVA